jgi:ribonuclease E
VASPSTGAGESGGGGRRRRGGRGGRGSDGAETPALGGYGEGGGNGSAVVLPAAQESPASDAPQRRQEPEVLAVPMDPEQELVFGWMGLSPALLLDPLPTGDSLMVRVVRPDADPEAVLEEARQQLAASGSRRRRRGRNGEGRNGMADANGIADANGMADAPDVAESPVVSGAFESPVSEAIPIFEITPAPFEPLPSSVPSEPVSVAVPSRRSPSRSIATAVPAPAATAAPVPVVVAAAVPAADPAGADAGEPRRRRRRSSAAG